MLIIRRWAEDAKDKYIKNENDPREPIVLDYVHVQDTFLHRKDNYEMDTAIWHHTLWQIRIDIGDADIKKINRNWNDHVSKKTTWNIITVSVVLPPWQGRSWSHTDSPSAAPMLRWSELELIHPPEPRLWTYRVCTYRVLSQLSVSGHFITSCLCKVAAAILVTILCPWSPLGWSKSPPTRHNRL